MIKVSRVTPYIPINISQIKFIELIRYSYSLSLIPLSFYSLTDFHSFPASPLLCNELSRGSIKSLAYEGLGGKFAKRYRGIPKWRFLLFADFFFFFFTFARKAKKQMAISWFSFLSESNITGHFPHLLHCLCATLLTIINSCSWFSPIRGEGYEFLAHLSHINADIHIISHHTYNYIELYTRTRVARNIINNNALMSWNISHLFFFFFLICNNSKRTARRCRWCGPVRDSFALGHQSRRL